MHYRWLIIAWMLALGACAASGDVDGTFTPAQFAQGLSAPADVARQAAATGGQHCGGWQYDHGFYGNVAQTDLSALFSPQWDPSAGQRDVAYALYRLDVAETFTTATLELDWQTAPEYWIGLGHNGRNTWEWHPAPAGAGLELTLAPYRFNNTQLLVVVVALGTTEAVLEAVDLETGGGGALRKMFFLHHSTGWGIISEGDMRGYIDAYNTAHGETFEFWDQGYNGDGPRNQDGETGYGTMYAVPGDNTNPDGLNYLWTSSEQDAVDCRNGLLNDYQVIAFKSCFPASAIDSNEMLDQYKTWYLEIRDFCDTHPEKLFVVMSTPPLVPEATNDGDALRARNFAEWLKSSAYLSGHPNIVCFDLFDALATPAAVETEANMLRPLYRGSTPGDSHPNAVANAAVGPVFAQFLIDSALAYMP